MNAFAILIDQIINLYIWTLLAYLATGWLIAFKIINPWQPINETMEIAGMTKALERSLEIDLELEGEGSIDKKVFLEELRKGGLRGALAWRDRRFGG